MPSPFQGINVASQALSAFQRALDTTGHNISNVNTPGYSRQTVDFTEQVPTTFFANHEQALGNGVTIASVNRVRDLFLEARTLGSNSDLGNTGAQLSGSQQIQSLLNEPSTSGISSALDQFTNAWSALGSNPGEAGNRIQVQLAGQHLADGIRTTYQGLKSLEGNTNDGIRSTITDINTLAQQIATLNVQVKAATGSGQIPNDLLDQRNLAIQNLSKLVDVNTQTYSDGTVAINVNQLMLVGSGGAQPFPNNYSATAGTVSDANGTYDIRSGKLSGLFAQVNAIQSAESQLDNIANTLRTQVNTLHQTGTTALGATKQNFFNDVTPPALQTGASNFDLDPAVKKNYQNIATGTGSYAGDGGVALQIAQLRDQPVAALGDSTVAKYYSTFVGGVGQAVRYFTNQQSTQGALATQINQQVQSTSGVSLDDEMSKMLVYQRSYQAAAKVLSTADQVLQSLLAMLAR